MSDSIHRFIFDSYGIRGELIKLTEVSQQILDNHHYPTPIAELVVQAAAVSVLLASTLKFEGQIALQLQSSGAFRMLLVQVNDQLGVRALARYDDTADFSNLGFKELVQGGQMSITISPKKGNRYQGIVPLEKESLAECIEAYFDQSEQLKTRIWLFNQNQHVCGVLLQALPDMLSQDSFEHLVYLASTLTTEECLTVDSEILLHRLFHQESVRGLTQQPVKFNCGCSERKMLASIMLLPAEEIDEILETKGEIAARCEFCLSQFKFTEVEIKQARGHQGNDTQH